MWWPRHHAGAGGAAAHGAALRERGRPAPRARAQAAVPAGVARAEGVAPSRACPRAAAVHLMPARMWLCPRTHNGFASETYRGGHGARAINRRGCVAWFSADGVRRQNPPPVGISVLPREQKAWLLSEVWGRAGAGSGRENRKENIL